jgi:hypothetical protein
MLSDSSEQSRSVGDAPRSSQLGGSGARLRTPSQQAPSQCSSTPRPPAALSNAVSPSFLSSRAASLSLPSSSAASPDAASTSAVPSNSSSQGRKRHPLAPTDSTCSAGPAGSSRSGGGSRPSSARETPHGLGASLTRKNPRLRYPPIPQPQSRTDPMNEMPLTARERPGDDPTRLLTHRNRPLISPRDRGRQQAVSELTPMTAPSSVSITRDGTPPRPPTSPQQPLQQEEGQRQLQLLLLLHLTQRHHLQRMQRAIQMLGQSRSSLPLQCDGCRRLIACWKACVGHTPEQRQDCAEVTIIACAQCCVVGFTVLALQNFSHFYDAALHLSSSLLG